MLCLFQPFMRIWVGEKAMFSFDVVIAICIYFYVWTIGDIKSQYADAAGLWWKDRIRASVEAIANIALNYVLVKNFGVLELLLRQQYQFYLLAFLGVQRLYLIIISKEKAFCVICVTKYFMQWLQL